MHTSPQESGLVYPFYMYICIVNKISEKRRIGTVGGSKCEEHLSLYTMPKL